ncbi:hypothetical protein K435DRAFT_792679 [Dendrothele bispora CBS 962.96]|uniref:Uncharacterized protein n=1 Tax=Dendrothele bispora (strain CBS 962.96) TaxID=1314807 RepID=A0A4S8MHY5_DENBC|nr:hypothetical protein K435DRAFT_792679 [Dendrothele bispora CBS 962.96]
MWGWMSMESELELELMIRNGSRQLRYSSVDIVGSHGGGKREIEKGRGTRKGKEQGKGKGKGKSRRKEKVEEGPPSVMMDDPSYDVCVPVPVPEPGPTSTASVMNDDSSLTINNDGVGDSHQHHLGSWSIEEHIQQEQPRVDFDDPLGFSFGAAMTAGFTDWWG